MLSIIEFAVYGFITYVSLLMLIISVVKEVPSGKTQSILRSMWLIPGMLTATLLAGSGININLINEGRSFVEVFNGTTGLLMTNSTIVQTAPDFIALTSPVWIIVHWMIFLVLLSYVIIQMLNLLVKTD